MKYFINKKLLTLTVAFLFFSLTAIFIQLFAFQPVAKYFSYETSISYNATGLCKSHIKDSFIERLYEQYAYEIENNLEFSGKSQLQEYERQHLVKLILIDGAAPLIFIILGIVGFVYLIKYKKNINYNNLSLIQWIAVFLNLFWFRWLLLLVLYIVFVSLSKKDNALLIINETNIAYALNISPLFILIPLGLFSTWICYITVFVFIPKVYRGKFLLTGVIGCILALLFWFKLIGAMVLPYE